MKHPILPSIDEPMTAEARVEATRLLDELTDPFPQFEIVAIDGKLFVALDGVSEWLTSRYGDDEDVLDAD